MSDFTKRIHDPIEFKTFIGTKGSKYLVFRGYDGDYHVFVEVEAKEAAPDCGEVENPNDNTRTMWGRLWEQKKQSRGSYLNNQLLLSLT